MRLRLCSPLLSLLLVTAYLLLAGRAFAQAAQNVDAYVSTTFGGLRYNRATSTFDAVGTIKNISTNTTLASPMSLIVTTISDASVTLANGAGKTAAGQPYINVPLSGGTLTPGASVGNVVLKFYNPKQVTFTYGTSTLALINSPPGLPAPPNLFITSPTNGALFKTQPIAVTGTVDDNAAVVIVNGVQAAVSGGRFTANVPLAREGMQTISAIATNAGGSSQAAIMVGLDMTAPLLTIDSPTNNAYSSDALAAVAGTVYDVMTPSPTVTVNGIPAVVSNGQYIAMGIPLSLGPNLITVVATDAVGNARTTTLNINRVIPSGPHLVIVSGQAQSALVSTVLPQPLVVQVVDGAGQPLANKKVVFQVSRGDGLLNSIPAQIQPDRTIGMQTNGNGMAGVNFQLGHRSGAGNNRVQVSLSTNPALNPTFVEFCATAVSGTPDHLAIITMSNEQTGVANRPLDMPFQVVVADAQGNPVVGTTVTFKVAQGGGSFMGSPTVDVLSGPDGIAQALLTLGTDAGTDNNVVEARLPGQNAAPLIFAASAKVPGKTGSTSFKGIVLDGENMPLPNATVSIVGSNVAGVTDGQGRFLLTGVPPGAQRLFINGATIQDNLGRIFPNLEFDTNAISGVENSLPFPVYLPPLATDNKSVRTITGQVTSDIVLQMPGLPQATLTLKAGTIVRNAAGPASASNPITVRFSRVNIDRVPMPPPNGGTFLLAFTTQPAGTHFDPPAAVCLPNVGAPPGSQVDIFSFDHGVGQFVPIGLATVTEDGARLCSNPGFGIASAGWGGCGAPPAPGTNCSNCSVSVDATPNPVCMITTGYGPYISEEVTVTATVTNQQSGDKLTWSGDTGITTNPSGSSFTTKYTSPGKHTVTATCGQSSVSVDIYVVQMEIEINNTPATNDDIVMVQDKVCTTRQLVDCRIHILGMPKNDVSVVLTSSDGKLRFPNTGDSQKPLILPKDGGWVAFKIGGEAASTSVNDTKIEVHKDSAGGTECTEQAATVFSFDPSSITLTSGGNYALAPSGANFVYTTAVGPAVSFASQATLKPSGLDCTVPQLKDIQIGIAQTSLGSTRTLTWGNPVPSWAASAPKGQQATVPTTIVRSLTRPVANDSCASCDPLYDKPGPEQIDANSIKPPIGCTNGGTATSSDTPQTPAAATMMMDMKDATGNTVGTVTYTLVSVMHQHSFRTWCVALDTSKNKLVQILREGTWGLNIDSTKANQRATTSADANATNCPVTGTPYSNDIVPTQTTTNNGSVTLTKP